MTGEKTGSKAATYIVASETVHCAVQNAHNSTHEDHGSHEHNADDDHFSGALGGPLGSHVLGAGNSVTC